MRTVTSLLAAVIAATAVPVAASPLRATFSGQILAVNPGTPANLDVGTPVIFSVVFDPSKLVDHTQSVNDATGLGFASVLTASLADDPLASLKINIGPVSFSKYDQINYGTPEGDCGPGCDLGAGNFPTVTYLDSAFAGIGNLFVNAAGYSFDADPIADAFGGFDLGDGNGGYKFFLGKVADGDPFATVLAVGNYDASRVVFSAVPEPGTWLLFIGGFALLAAKLRKRSGRPQDNQTQAVTL